MKQTDLLHVRSQLFVPGNRPDRFEKACQTEADLVCIDLEDAVGPSDKDTARDAVLKWLSETSHSHVSVRINSVETQAGKADILALEKSGLTLPFIMIPKVSKKGELKDLDGRLPDALGPFFAIIESAEGLVNSAEILAHSRVKLGMYGAVDYAGDVDCDLSWETHLYARCKLVAEANAFGVLLFDTPHIEVRNLEDCEITTRKAKDLGLHARSAIHPDQIKRIHEAFTPSPAEVAYAETVIAAYKAAEGHVVLLDGKFIEMPVVKRAKRVLARINRQK